MNDTSKFGDVKGVAEVLDRALVDPARLFSSASTGTPELDRLVSLAQTIQKSTSDVKPSAEFRMAGRQRLLNRIASAPESRQQQRAFRPIFDRVTLWATRLAAGLAALSFAGAATASAAASAVPGEPLYALKQAGEALAFQTAPTDAARQEVLLRRADARLDETARLLAQGRDGDAAATAAGFDETVAGVTEAASPPSEVVQASLEADRTRLAQLLQTAPPRARPGLERALHTTERWLARPRPNSPVRLDEKAKPAATPETRAAGDRGSNDGDEAATRDEDEAASGAGQNPAAGHVGDAVGGERPANATAVGERPAIAHGNPQPAVRQRQMPTPPKSQDVRPSSHAPAGRGRP